MGKYILLIVCRHLVNIRLISEFTVCFYAKWYLQANGALFLDINATVEKTLFRCSFKLSTIVIFSIQSTKIKLFFEKNNDTMLFYSNI